MKYSTYVILSVTSIILVLTSVLLPVEVNSRNDLQEVSFGLPLGFIRQYQGNTGPPFFPWQTHLSSIWEHPIDILWLYFLLDIAIIFGVLCLILNLLKLIGR